MPQLPEFLPAAELETLQRRSAILRDCRAFFFAHGYWEAETPLLSRDSCIDRWLDPFEVTFSSGERRYLQTSPEFALKRLVCAGAERIFEVTRSFRQAEIGDRHNPEFTMVEWYQRHANYHEQMDLVEELVLSLLQIDERRQWTSARPPRDRVFHRLSYADAFQRQIGLCPMSATNEELAAAAAAGTSRLPAGLEDDRDGLLDFLLTDRIEPGFKELGAVFLYDYPASQAALARVRPDALPVAERFELYLDGIEICNGYQELTDAAELRTRMQRQNERRIHDGKPSLPIESRLLNAMEHGLPECSGVALGFDRLVMWLLGLRKLTEVLAFPFDRA